MLTTASGGSEPMPALGPLGASSLAATMTHSQFRGDNAGPAPDLLSVQCSCSLDSMFTFWQGKNGVMGVARRSAAATGGRMCKGWKCASGSSRRLFLAVSLGARAGRCAGRGRGGAGRNARLHACPRPAPSARGAHGGLRDWRHVTRPPQRLRWSRHSSWACTRTRRKRHSCPHSDASN